MVLDLFKYVFESLEERKIDYLLSGSYALNLYTTPRNTRDIDIVVDLEANNLENFLNIFKKGYYYNRPSILKEVERKRIFNIIHEKEAFKFDFIVKKNDELSNEQFRRKTYLKINGFKAWVISAEDLILSKLQWIQKSESALQKHDIEELMEIKNIDKEYILHWCKKFHINTFNIF